MLERKKDKISYKQSLRILTSDDAGAGGGSVKNSHNHISFCGDIERKKILGVLIANAG